MITGSSVYFMDGQWGALHISIVFMKKIQTILKPMTVLCELYAMYIASPLSISKIPYF